MSKTRIFQPRDSEADIYSPMKFKSNGSALTIKESPVPKSLQALRRPHLQNLSFASNASFIALRKDRQIDKQK
jgi:hypothetical protein